MTDQRWAALAAASGGGVSGGGGSVSLGSEGVKGGAHRVHGVVGVLEVPSVCRGARWSCGDSSPELVTASGSLS